MKNTYLFALLVAIAVIGGYYYVKKSTPIAPPTPVVDTTPIIVEDFEGEADPDIMTLNMHTWTWVNTTYNNDTILTPKRSDAFTITFGDDSRFSATTDCNAMSGDYAVDGNKITFGENIAMTRMFCEGSQEMEFASFLTEIQSFFFTSRGQLVFDLKFDSGSATFR